MTRARPFAVLFDLDGTLIDSIGLLLECVRHTFESRTPAPTDAEWIAGIGTPLRKQLAPYVTSDAEAEGLIARYRAFQRLHHDRLTAAYPGVVDTLTELDRRGHPMGVVTSKSNEMMNMGLEHVGLDRFMKTKIGMDSCTIHKPDPFPVRLALDELGYSPREAVFVGDSPHDIQSGNAAGVVSIAALWGPFTRAQLEPSRPRLFLERITDLPAIVQTVEETCTK
ncbi:MAG TPA: HAD-IA family hydrolase [Gemmatimonadaceae bacterium]|nr:HAD-IA family hydrolase [Gemmatimonadaceae bacterium]